MATPGEKILLAYYWSSENRA